MNPYVTQLSLPMTRSTCRDGRPTALEDAVEFAENPEPRCPCVLLLDTSGSMNGAPLQALNAGLQSFKTEIVKDNLASRRVEIAVVTFNNEIAVEQDFVTADQFAPPTLTARGMTHMGAAINKALDMVQARKTHTAPMASRTTAPGCS